MIFVDTSFWAALRIRDDSNHALARELYDRFKAERLLTSVPVRGETWTFLRRRVGHPSAVHFLDMLAASQRTTVTPFPVEFEERVFAWLRQHDEREYSYVDATSFMLMRERRVTRALAFDGDFAAAGFVELR